MAHIVRATPAGESCHTYEKVIARTVCATTADESYQTNEWITTHILRISSRWVMSHVWMSHGTYLNESCHTFAWVMSHIWMSHVTLMNESWHTSRAQLLQISHDTHMIESWHTLLTSCCNVYGWDMSPVNESCQKFEWTCHVWMSHVTNMIKSCHACESRCAHATLMDESVMNESWHTYEWVMSPETVTSHL